MAYTSAYDVHMGTSPELGVLLRMGDGRAGDERPSLSRAGIVTAAIELADAEGLDAVSMSRVAGRLGFTTMSLYRHVAGKEELLLLMINFALGAPGEPDAPVDSWRGGLERWAWELLEVVRRHLWALRVPPARSIGPSALAWLDYGLRALEHTALSEAEKAEVILLLNGHVFWQARLFEEAVSPAPAVGSAVSHSAQLAAAVDRDQFPALHRALEARIFDAERDPEAAFAFGLQRILDGIECLIEGRSKA
jgi:AcrR family transcriptional regulator